MRSNIKKIYAEINKLYCIYVLTGKKDPLRRACDIADSCRSIASDIRLSAAMSLMLIELDDIKLGDRYLSAVDKYRKFLRANEPTAYGIYLYACSLASIKKDKAISAFKYMDRLVSEYKQGKYLCGVLAAFLYDIAEHYEAEGFMMLVDCYRHGERSRFFYCVLYRYYANGKVKTVNLLNTTVKWSIMHDVSADWFINGYRDDLGVRLTDPVGYVYKLCSKYNYDFITEQAVRYFINNFDHSPYALEIYKKALADGIEINGLYDAYLSAAVKNGETDFPDNIYKYFFEHPSDNKVLMSSIYMRDIKNGVFDANILKFALNCLDDPIMNAYVYMNGRKAETADAVIAAAGKQTANNIFAYTLEYNKRAEAVKYAAVKNEVTGEVDITKIQNGKGRIISSQGDFSVFLMDSSKRMITGVKINLSPVLPFAVPQLARMLYNDGFKNKPIYEYLADEICQSETIEKDDINILEEAAELGIMTDKLCYILFTVYAEEKDKTNAERCLAKTNIYLNDDLASEYVCKKAVELESMPIAFKVLEEYESMDKYSIRDIVVMLYEKKYDKAADYAYKLFMDGFGDDELLIIIFENYSGNSKEWDAFFSLLYKENIDDEVLCAVTADKCLKFHLFGKYFENSLRVLKGKNNYSELAEDMIDALCGEIMGRERNVSAELTNILEDFFEETEDYMTAFALGHIYVRQKLSTKRSEAISHELVKICEKTNISFPIFYYTENEIFKTPFIIKNKPLLYKTRENKKVFVLIKLGGAKAKPIKKSMTEIKYGIYIFLLPLFMGEKISYCFEENVNGNSVLTHWRVEGCPECNMLSFESDDLFFAINNSLNNVAFGNYRHVESALEGIARTSQNNDFELM